MNCQPKDPAALSRLDCLLFSMTGYRSAWKFRDPHNNMLEVPVTGHLLISHGFSPALLPDLLYQDEIHNGLLVDLFPDYACTATEFDTAAWLVYQSRSYLPPKVRVFVDFLQAKIMTTA